MIWWRSTAAEDSEAGEYTGLPRVLLQFVRSVELVMDLDVWALMGMMTWTGNAHAGGFFVG